jgi:hypothetical protein
VLFSDVPDENRLAIAIRDGYAKDSLAEEDALGVMSKSAVAKVSQECLGLVKPIVNREIILGLATELSGAPLRVLEWVRHG